MEIFPAIDLRHGQVVRLTEGDYDQMIVYDRDPVQVAKQFIAKGAKNLHLVDLDGAKDGTPENFDAIRKVVELGGLFIEVGGGIRNEQRILDYLQLGVNRVIVGTAAVTNFSWVAQMVDKYGEKIAAGVDARDGFVAINGWKEITKTRSMDLCRQLSDVGTQTIVYTDISKDGRMEGTNLEIYQMINQIAGIQVIASGGISFEEEIIALRDMNLYAAIVGKAVYEGALDLERVIPLAEQETGAF